MAIEITGMPTTQVTDSNGSTQTKALQKETNQQQAGKAAAASTDRVTLTDSAAKLQQLEKDLSKLPVVDENRVESLKKAIASGEYKIDPTKTAEKFLQIESALNK